MEELALLALRKLSDTGFVLQEQELLLLDQALSAPNQTDGQMLEKLNAVFKDQPGYAAFHNEMLRSLRGIWKGVDAFEQVQLGLWEFYSAQYNLKVQRQQEERQQQLSALKQVPPPAAVEDEGEKQYLFQQKEPEDNALLLSGAPVAETQPQAERPLTAAERLKQEREKVLDRIQTKSKAYLERADLAYAASQTRPVQKKAYEYQYQNCFGVQHLDPCGLRLFQEAAVPHVPCKQAVKKSADPIELELMNLRPKQSERYQTYMFAATLQ